MGHGHPLSSARVGNMKSPSPLTTVALTSFLSLSLPALVSASHLHPKVYPPGPLKVDKRAPQVTQPARFLGRRGSQQTCATSYSLCASSLDGGCCPENYECGTASCFATSAKPGTCAGKTSYHPCGQDVGGGCCPDGYSCNRSNGCVPPSGMPYTYSCPASHYLCPASQSYGCCPNGMGCAMYQCYATESTTRTNAVTVTMTEDGTAKTVTATEVTVIPPSSPSSDPTGGSQGSGNDDQNLKYFPSTVPKMSSSSVASSDDHDNSISTGTVVGIVVGAIAFLVLAIGGAIVLVRYINRLARNTAPAHGSNHRPGQYRPTPTDVDAMSEDTFLMKSPGQVHARSVSGSDSPYGPASPDVMSTLSVTPSSFAGGYRPVSPGHSSSSVPDHGQPNTAVTSYFEPIHSRRSSQKTPKSANARSSAGGGSSKRTSGGGGVWTGRLSALAHSRSRHRSNDDSDQRSESAATSTPSELEAKKYVAELPERASLTRNEVRMLSSNAGNVPELVKKEASRRRKVAAAGGREERGPASATKKTEEEEQPPMSPNGALYPELNMGLGVVSEENGEESRTGQRVVWR